ncbi:hypothetical protein [Filimonas effusa]|uniref:Lipocalin-like domain-containing protein n=1 Tax=Filimonas effusa TaxID=2508721 RepID=A0A4Q1D516_9BACT|nr:hypothetical protein [Filimonas effusa]RXK82923.1 hypothetical protein ESB13_12405 [Filimonas effusa]
MKLLYIMLAAFLLLSCAKEKEQYSTNSIVGSWKLIETRNDPGDGSGRFIAAQDEATITFTPSGEYNDTRNNLYNRYEMVTNDTVRLSHNLKPTVKLLAIQELTSGTLTYFHGWPWCGGPSGEKFSRQGKQSY